MTGRLRLGTSSWGERGWVGSFYPARMAPRDFLSYYATRFDTVEADNTYYAVPSPELVPPRPACRSAVFLQRGLK